jgi:hypothetical protein
MKKLGFQSVNVAFQPFDFSSLLYFDIFKLRKMRRMTIFLARYYKSELIPFEGPAD